MKDKTIYITKTAILIALLVTFQFITRAFGQFVTGSCVNLILAIATLFVGMVSGITVAILSPFFAFLLGIGTPLIQIVPIIAIGNLVYVILIGLLFKKIKIGSVFVASAIKCFVLYCLVVKVAIPLIGLPSEKAKVLSASFSWPQIVTGIIGGTIAILLLPRLRKGMKEEK